MEFKGTYLDHLSGNYTVQDDFRKPKVIHEKSIVCEIQHFFKDTVNNAGEERSTGLSARQMRFLAETFAESMNVRQQIDCSLTELLEQRNYILSHLKVLHLYIELLKKGGDFNNLLHCATERIINKIDNKKQA